MEEILNKFIFSTVDYSPAELMQSLLVLASRCQHRGMIASVGIAISVSINASISVSATMWQGSGGPLDKPAGGMEFPEGSNGFSMIHLNG